MNMMYTGMQGAKVQSWKKANPRDLLKSIIEQNPASGKDAIFKKFKTRLASNKNHEQLIDSIMEYWFTNNFHSLIALPQCDDEKAAREKRIKKFATKIQKRLLDMQLPNGKKLSESTFGYCKKLGGGLARIGAAGKSNELVGKVLSETKIKKLYTEKA